MKIYPKSKTDGVIVRKAGAETVIYEIATDRASALNATASEMFDLCDGSRDLDAIAEAAGQDVAIVKLALDQIARADLLEDAAAHRLPRGAGHSRRKILQSAGLGAAIVLPVVSTISTPTPAQTLSVPEACINITDPLFCDSTAQCVAEKGEGFVCSKPRNPNGNCADPFQCIPDGCQNLPGQPPCPVR